MNRIPDNFVFMKVGMHAAESLEIILERKQKELKAAGRIFWGYGGAVCHPVKQVQPFVRSRLLEGNNEIFLLMESINSKANPAIAPAREYSEDGRNWIPIPKGIKVTGSRYALVLDEIIPTTLVLDPREFVVGVGASKGMSANDYIGHRVDKGCLERSEKPVQNLRGRTHAIGLAARLQDPYAVFVRP